MPVPLLRLDRVRKSFGNNLAVDDVTLEIERGEVVCLLGENGAGKSTIMNIAAGVLRPDRGAIVVDGETVTALDPRRASELGIAMVHQHFVLVPALTAAENLVLSNPPATFYLSAAKLMRRAAALVRESEIDFQPLGTPVRDLSVGEKSRLELIRVLARRPRVLILDEPTAVLAPPEVAQLGTVVRRLAQNGTAVVFITHKLAEVFELADRIVVMRRGRIVREATPAQITPSQLAGEIVELQSEHRDPSSRTAGDEVLALENVSSKARAHSVPLDNVSFLVRRRQIVAMVGVAGNGQDALAAVLRGLEPLSSGRIRLQGERIDPARLQENRAVGHVPADRTENGLVQQLSLADNLVLASDLREYRARYTAAGQIIEEFRIRAVSPAAPVSSLSGGNQQKVLLARELSRHPALLVAGEPTRGLDVDAAQAIHQRLRDGARDGAGIVLITSDLDEARTLADSIHVMYRGRVSAALPADGPIEVLAQKMAGLE